MKTLLPSLVALYCGVSSAHAAISFTAVRDYDATTNANVVDNNATALTAAAFGTMVASAFDSGAGGVVNFDNGTVGATGDWTVSYAGGGKSLAVGISHPSASINMDAVAGIRATPISGNTYYRFGGNDTSRISNTLTFATGNYLSAFGMTFLARGAALGNIYITGTYSDGSAFTLFDSTNPFSIAANTVTTAPPGGYLDSPNSGVDRFVGFTAEPGKAIATLVVSVPAATYPVIDDFGFIVSPIPEPSGALLLTLSMAGLVSRRRRA